MKQPDKFTKEFWTIEIIQVTYGVLADIKFIILYLNNTRAENKEVQLGLHP